MSNKANVYADCAAMYTALVGIVAAEFVIHQGHTLEGSIIGIPSALLLYLAATSIRRGSPR